MAGRISIVADDRVPFLDGVFDGMADIAFKCGSEIVHEDLLCADALIVRTRTKCNEALLGGTPVKLIATATIGTDHIDLDYCNAHGISVCNAAGCNAGGVMQYVFSAIFALAVRNHFDPRNTVLGIVGAGHVGKQVIMAAEALGMKVLVCDPPRAAVEGSQNFVALEYLLKNADIVSMHVPLTETTYNMCDNHFFALMKDGSIFINAARGEVVHEDSLIQYKSKFQGIVIDTWHGEACGINENLLAIADIATPHIAGYSFQGKTNGTAMVVQAISRYFKFGSLDSFTPVVPADKSLVMIDTGKTDNSYIQIYNEMSQFYDIFKDDHDLRRDCSAFETLRNNYNYRREIQFIKQ